MKQTLILAAGASGAFATSLSNICNFDYITSSLPSDDSAVQGLVYGDVTAQPVYNSSVEAGNNYPAVSGRNFCNVTVAYKHAGKDDAVSMVSIDSAEAGTDNL
jgi:tannase